MINFFTSSTFLYLWTVLACEDGKTKEPDTRQVLTACELAGHWPDENESCATNGNVDT
jgi:hypothetical protein